MSLRVSGKNVDVGDALRGHIETRVDGAVDKYFSGGYSGHVTLTKDGSSFRTEMVIHLDSGADLQSTGLSHDPHQSADESIDKLEKRLRRYKRRLKDHHANHRNGFDMVPAAAYVIESMDDNDEVPEDYAPAVIAESSTKVRTLTVAMAVMDMDLSGAPVLVFKNAGNGSLNVVYKREDGNIGWIDPALVKEDA